MANGRETSSTPRAGGTDCGAGAVDIGGAGAMALRRATWSLGGALGHAEEEARYGFHWRYLYNKLFPAQRLSHIYIPRHLAAL